MLRPVLNLFCVEIRRRRRENGTIECVSCCARTSFCEPSKLIAPVNQDLSVPHNQPCLVSSTRILRRQHTAFVSDRLSFLSVEYLCETLFHPMTTVAYFNPTTVMNEFALLSKPHGSDGTTTDHLLCVQTHSRSRPFNRTSDLRLPLIPCQN